MFLEIIKAKYIKGYELELHFNNGKYKIVNLEYELKGKVFEALKVVSYFKTFTIPYNTIEWSNGADFAPEYLYELANQQTLKQKVSKTMNCE